MLNQTVFRERDICGLADSDLADEDVEILGKALASYLIRYSGRTICVGRDSRKSSTRLHAALLKGLKSAGARVLDIDEVPPPVLYFSAIHLSADAAIMITGGDETPEHNGFKVVCGASFLFGRALQDIYKLMTAGDFEGDQGHIEQVDGLAPYIQQLVSQFQFSSEARIFLEPGTTIGKPLLQQLFGELKVSLAKKNEAVVSIAISDGADRLKVMDEKGKPVPPEMLLLLFGREILTRKPESVLLYDEQFPDSIVLKLIELGGKPVAITPSEPSVQARLKQEHAELSVQASGEIVFADRYYGFEDAIYASCRLLEIAVSIDDSLSAEVRDLAQDSKPAA